MRAQDDEALRVLALEMLGPLAEPLAREALESAVVQVEPDVLAWTGTAGEMRGHRVVVWLEPELANHVSSTPSVVDALTAALAAGVARTGGNALAELQVRPRSGPPPKRSPYRGRF